jgi:hypothetical protein
MADKLIVIALVLVTAGIVIFVFAPVVYYPSPPPPALASLGSVPSYQSLSCTFFGIGSGLWRVYYNTANGLNYSEWTWSWTYHLSCT